MDQLFALGNVPDGRGTFEITVCDPPDDRRAAQCLWAQIDGPLYLTAKDRLVPPTLHARLAQAIPK
jgi:hypothetical protein